jgi:hypothetical protein
MTVSATVNGLALLPLFVALGAYLLALYARHRVARGARPDLVRTGPCRRCGSPTGYLHGGLVHLDPYHPEDHRPKPGGDLPADDAFWRRRIPNRKDPTT